VVPVYVRHRPEDTVLYAVVEEHAEAFFARLGEQGASLPAFVHEEFERYHGVLASNARHRHLVANAKAYLAMRDAGEDFAAFVWAFVDGRPRRNRFGGLTEVPSQTTESQRMSKELKRRGFRFVGPTTCYAFMQATCMIDDHVVTCFPHGAEDAPPM